MSGHDDDDAADDDFAPPGGGLQVNKGGSRSIERHDDDDDDSVPPPIVVVVVGAEMSLSACVAARVARTRFAGCPSGAKQTATPPTTSSGRGQRTIFDSHKRDERASEREEKEQHYRVTCVLRCSSVLLEAAGPIDRFIALQLSISSGYYFIERAAREQTSGPLRTNCIIIISIIAFASAAVVVIGRASERRPRQRPHERAAH